MAHRFLEYQPWKGEIERRTNGSIIAMETGTAYAYALNNLQSRGRFFIAPGDEVYAGQVVGEHTKDNDLVVNVTKSKKLPVRMIKCLWLLLRCSAWKMLWNISKAMNM